MRHHASLRLKPALGALEAAFALGEILGDAATVAPAPTKTKPLSLLTFPPSGFNVRSEGYQIAGKRKFHRPTQLLLPTPAAKTSRTLRSGLSETCATKNRNRNRTIEPATGSGINNEG